LTVQAFYFEAQVNILGQWPDIQFGFIKKKAMFPAMMIFSISRRANETLKIPL
jgi:hypothetical protein